MAFDPDAYLGNTQTSTPASAGFDPDAYLAKPAPSRGVTPWRAPENARQPEPVATPAAAPPPEPTLDTFMAPPTAALKRSLRAPALEERAAKVKEEEAGKVSFDQLYKDPNNLKVINDFVATRFGKGEMQKPDESAEDFVKRFASQMRFLDAGNEITYTKELQWLNSASNEDKLKAGAAYTLWENTATPFTGGGNKGQLGVAPVLDYLAAILTSPSTVASIGVGTAIKSTLGKAVAEKGLKQAVKSNVGKVLAIPATEFVGGAAQSTMAQKKDLTIADAQVKQMEKIFPSLSPEDQAIVQPQIDELKKKVQEGVSVVEAALTGGVGAVMGTAETVGLLKAAKALRGKPTGQLSDILATRRSAMDPTIPVVEVKPGTAKLAGEAQLEDAYDIFEGRKLLNKEGDPSAVAEMQIRNDINQKATVLARNIWEAQPEFAPQAGQKISDAVKNVFQNIDVVDEVALKDAFAKADITPEEFARMNRTTVGDAGRTLQAYSVLARIQNKLKSIDKAAAKEVDAMYGRENMVSTSFNWLHDSVNSLDKNLKALMVSQIATTMRNIYGTMAVTGFQAATEAFESTLYRTGKSLYEVGTGKPLTGTFTGGIKGIYDDAFRTAFYLQEHGLTGELADQLLSSSPTLKSLIVKTAGEAGDTGLWKGAQIANTFNAVSDSFVRKAYFTASVEKQLSRAGLDMYDILAQNKNIPLDVLKNATDEALKATMSYMPKTGKGKVENIMATGVKFVEALGPVGSTVLPFPRFMANAMSWTANHSPIGAFVGAADGLMAKNEAQRIAALNQFSKGMVGTSAIYAAYKYRKENQDKEWYDVDTGGGSLVDTRAIFPLSPFLAMGDYLVKMENNRTDEFKTSDFVSAMTGFKLPAGTTNWLGDKFAESVANLKGTATGEDVGQNKVARFFGEWAGQYLGRAAIPLSQFSDLFGAIDRNETLPRSVYASEQAATPAGEFAQAAALQLKSKIPVLKQELPVATSATRLETPFNDAGLVKMFTGINFKVNPTEFEKEITRLDIQPTKIYSSTGDKVVDAQAKQMLAPVLIDSYKALSSTDFYQNASQDMQKIAFNNMLSTLQTDFKNVAIDMSRAEAMNKGKSAVVIENRYAAMAPEVKREAAKLYTANTGKNLEETKDYETGLAYAAAISSILKASPTKPKFAEGGVVRKVFGEALSTSITKAGGNILQQMEEMLAKNRAAKMAAPAGEITPVIKAQMKDAVNTSAANMPSKKAMPTPKAAAEEPAMPVPATPEAIPTELPRSTSKVVSDTEPYFGDIEGEGRFTLPEEAISAPTSATSSLPPMTEDQFKEALAQQVNAFGFKSVLKKIDSAPEEFAGKLEYNLSKGLNLPPLEVHPLTIPVERQKELIQEFENSVVGDQYDKYLKAKELNDSIPDFDINKPYSWDDTWTPEYTGGKTKAVTTKTDEALGLEEAKPYTVPNNLQKMDVNDTLKNVTSTDVSRRKSLLSSIREQRSKDFPLLLKLPVSKNLSDAEDVMAVVQGDFRLANKKEIDLSSPKDIAIVSEMAKKAQDRLDALRIEYKDEPPMKLFHGKDVSKGVTTRYKTGFQDPQAHGTPHSELGVGGTSFTKDINLNFEKLSFGGPNAKQLIYTEIPYADFVFKQVNMSPLMYDETNLDVIARAINGSDRVVRTLSLPRSHYFKETEEVILETDKLRPEGKATNGALEIKSAKEEAAKRLAGAEDESSNTIGFLKRKEKQNEIASNLYGTFEILKKADKMGAAYKDGLITVNEMKGVLSGYTPDTIAFKAYKEVKDLLNNILEKGSITSVKTGLGQRYHNEVLQLSAAIRVPNANDIISTPQLLGETENLLRKLGHTEKANNIKNLMGNLDQIRKLDRFASDARDVLPQIKNVNNIRELTPKFSEGGLASKIKDVENSLTSGEKKLVDYHRNVVRSGTQGKDEKGNPITVWSTTVKMDDGPAKGMYATVPGYIDGKRRDEDTAREYWRTEINKGEWPLYSSPDRANERAKHIHKIMDMETENKFSKGGLASRVM